MQKPIPPGEQQEHADEFALVDPERRNENK